VKLKLDENIPGAVVEIIRAREFDVDTVLDELLVDGATPMCWQRQHPKVGCC
jgi:hypothetical protein